MPLTAADLLAELEELGIQTCTVEHPPVFTVDEARALRGELPGGHSKSLFLRNRKGRKMFLIVALEDRDIDLRALGERLDAGRLSFGSTERLMEFLGVIPGAVTPFAIANDAGNRVEVILDRELLEREPLNFHPLENDKTTAISAAGLLAFLRARGHEPRIMDLS